MQKHCIIRIKKCQYLLTFSFKIKIRFLFLTIDKLVFLRYNAIVTIEVQQPPFWGITTGGLEYGEYRWW